MLTVEVFPYRPQSNARNPYGESLLSRLWYPVTWRHEGWGYGIPDADVRATYRHGDGIGPMKALSAMRAQGRSVIAWQGDDKDKVQTVRARPMSSSAWNWR